MWLVLSLSMDVIFLCDWLAEILREQSEAVPANDKLLPLRTNVVLSECICAVVDASLVV
jgi:hypothetical protein